MDLKLIRNLVRILERSEVDELEIEDDKAGLRVHLRRGSSSSGGGPVVMMPGAAAAPAAAPAPAPAAPEADAPAARPQGVEEITSPMIGTFYRAPSPDSDPFVDVGARVDDEAVVCIIEAMKVMNEIKAEREFEILEVLVKNGEPVEFGQPMFLIR